MQTVKLGTICDIQAGGTPSRAEPVYWKNGTIPWVKISDFDGGNVRTTEESITQEGLDNSSAKLFPKGTILYTIFATLGEVAVLQMEAATNQAIAGLHLHDERIDAAYLYYFLISIKEKVLRLGRGVTQNNINLKILRNIDVPVPPLAEQQRIVRELQQVGALLANRRQVDEQLAELPKARFVEMFGDPVVNPMGWEKFPLGNLCESIVDCPHSTPTYYKEDTGYGCIRTSIIKKGQILWDNLEYISSTEYAQRIRRRVPRKGDIVYTREGAILGIAAVIDCNRKVALGQRSMLLSPNKKICNETFLCSVMNADTFFTYATRGMNGTASPHINVKDIKKIPVPLPPLPAQRRFAAFARACAAQRAACARQIAVLETLRGKLLQDAFGAAG
ncbi:MAG: restriction endonuclease subunit S [Selenomonas sp.]